jgi:hypothetical protein
MCSLVPGRPGFCPPPQRRTHLPTFLAEGVFDSVRPEEPPSFGGVSKGVLARTSTLSLPAGHRFPGVTRGRRRCSGQACKTSKPHPRPPGTVDLVRLTGKQSKLPSPASLAGEGLLGTPWQQTGQHSSSSTVPLTPKRGVGGMSSSSPIRRHIRIGGQGGRPV